MNAARVAAAAGVILAAQQTRQTAAGIAMALESAQLLQSPETAAELVVLREEIAAAHAWIDEHTPQPTTVPDAIVRVLRWLNEDRRQLRTRVAELERLARLATEADAEDRVARSVAAQFPKVAAFLAEEPAPVADARCLGCGQGLDEENIGDFCSDRCESVARLRELLGHQRQAEDTYRSDLHHDYRVPRDLTVALVELAAPGAEDALQARISGPQTTCAECHDVTIPAGETYCSPRCRNKDDAHDLHDNNQEGDVDA